MKKKQRRLALTDNASHKTLSEYPINPDMPPTDSKSVGDVNTHALSSSKKSERKCVVTGEVSDKDNLIRFVQDPEGRVMADLAGKLPGRGVWVTPSYETIEKAALKSGFARGFKTKNPSLSHGDFANFIKDIQERQLARCMDALGLARRAGNLVTGFDKVHEALKAEQRGGLVIIAHDAGRDGTAKLVRLATHKDITVMAGFSTSMISKALGFEQLGYAYISLTAGHNNRLKSREHTHNAKRSATGIGNKILNEVIKYQGLIPDPSKKQQI